MLSGILGLQDMLISREVFCTCAADEQSHSDQLMQAILGLMHLKATQQPFANAAWQIAMEIVPIIHSGILRL